MKTLYLCFTPYHIKVSNYLSEIDYENNGNHLLLSSFAGVPEEKLRKFVEMDHFLTLDYIDPMFSLRQLRLHGWSYIRDCRERVNSFVQVVIAAQYEKIVYFSDDPVAVQILFNDLKKLPNPPEFMFVEEGTGIYLINFTFTFKHKLLIHLARRFFNRSDIRLLRHGEGGYEDKVLLREPDLFKSKGEKIKLTKEEYRKIIFDHPKFMDMEILEGSFFCPSNIVDCIESRNRAFNEVFSHYYTNKKHLYVKWHPSEKNAESIREIIHGYDGYIHLIDYDGITAEDVVVHPNIKEVLSDISSVLINAYYLRDDIRITSYYPLLRKKYGINIIYQYSIFNNMVEKGIITSFLGY